MVLANLNHPLSFASLFQELETRIETQKQTLQARDESIKKLLEMLQSKGEGKAHEREKKLRRREQGWDVTEIHSHILLRVYARRTVLAKSSSGALLALPP